MRGKQDTKIRLVYLQPVDIDLGVGRYIYPLQEGGVDEEKMQFWSSDESVKASFSFNINVHSSYPIEGLRFPAHHNAVLNKMSDNEWQGQLSSTASSAVSVEELEQQSGMRLERKEQVTVAQQLNEDIVVYWKHKTGLPSSVDLVAYREENKQPVSYTHLTLPTIYSV